LTRKYDPEVLAFTTSYSGMVDRADLKAGQTVLVQGGVGHISAQLARACSGAVWATASEKDQEVVRRLGRDDFIRAESRAGF
jgi:NADPH2:quinone reductase